MVPTTKTPDGLEQLKRDLPRLLGRTSLTWLPLMLLLGAGFVHFYRHELDSHLNDVRSDAQIYVQDALNALRYRLPWIAKDTIFLKELQEMSLSWDADSATRKSRLANLFAAFMSQRSKLYAQIRILDPSGQELVRVDNDHGVPKIAPQEQLQDKSGRYYVKAIRELKRNEIYLSPFDLNIEHHEVERPIIPTLRFGARTGQSGDQQGSLLILNYFGHDLIARLSQAFPRHPEHFWLINEEGYWLKGPKTEDDWGFMLPEREGANMAQRYPALWQAMLAAPAGGQRLVEQGLLTYAQFNPAEDLRIPGHQIQFPSGHRWYVVEYLPEETFLETRQALRRGLILGYAAIGLLLAATLFYTGWLSERRRRSAKELADSRKRFLSLLESTPDAIVVSDSEGHIVLTNDQALALFGYTQEELYGQPVEVLLPQQYRDVHVHQRAGYLSDPQRRAMGNERTLQAQRKDGAIFPVDISLNSVDTSEGRLVISEVRDISIKLANERKILDLNRELSRHNEELEDRVRGRTAELEQARREAERMTRLKSEFLANMSHEIRTPMNAILGFAYLLERVSLPPEAAEPVAKIALAGRSLQHIINDILDFSKLEAGRLEIERAPFEIGRILDNLAAILSHVLGSKEIELTIVPPPPQGNCVNGDALRLEQVLINLGSNAIKFTEQGQVCIRVDLLAVEEEKVHLRFAVSDTGIGISPPQQQEIFTPFAQADGSTTRRFGGTGLGLSISRQLVSLMGGDLEMRSEEGRGSEFSFVLTLERAGKMPAQRLVAGPSLLIADDNQAARESIKRAAELLGWLAQTVDSGATVLGQLSGGETHSTNTVVMLDWKMPNPDGLATARLIRDSKGEEANLPIVIMTNHSEWDQFTALPDARLVDAVLEKPVTVSALRDAIGRAQKAKRGEPAAAKPPGRELQQRLAGMKILVVDDSEINREVAQYIFAGEGASVTLSADGQQALELLNQAEARYDIVLMDIQMPILDGHEATRAIRRNPSLANLPVVAVSAGAFKEQREQAEAAGMDGFIPKPLEVEAAVELILLVTGRLQERRAVANETVLFPAKNAETYPGIDTAQGIARLGEERYRHFLRMFAQEHGSVMEKIDGLSSEQSGALLHNLKGVAGNLSLPQVAALAAEAEQRLKNNAEAGDSLIRLRASMDTTLASIARFAPADKLE